MSGSYAQYPYVGNDPAEVESAMGDLQGVGRTLGSLAGEVEHDTQSIKDSWPKGRTGGLAAADAARMGGALDECHQVFARAERALSKLYPVLVAGRRKVDDLNHAYLVLAGPVNSYDGALAAGFPNLARPQQLFVAEDTLRAARARSGFESLADIDRAYAQVRAQVTEETTICDELLNRLAAQASGMPGHAAGKSKFDVSFGLLWETNQVAGILDGSIRFPADPKGVHQAWLQLSPDQQAELLHARPLWFGNLNGIPAADRNIANRATLSAQLLLLEKACEEVGIATPNRPEGFDQIPPDIPSIMESLGFSVQGARQALLLDAQLRRNGKFGAQLLAYEPGAYGGKGRAAIAFGAVDVDQADNVVFCVPGLMSSLGNVNNVASDALHLFGAALLADPGRDTVVVAWQGYDAPNWAQVVFQDSAEQGAKLLAADVNAMRTTHGGPIGMLTVVAHSYGSTTTGLALQREHLDVGQVALIGSPGVGGDAKAVADLHLLPSQVFVGSASTDIVTDSPGLLGADPAEAGFGGTRTKAEVVGRGATVNFGDHSHYFDAVLKGESLYTLAEIAAGHGDRLAQDGMLAQPRYIKTVLTGDGSSVQVEIDPEASRTPTTGHDHANDVLYELRKPGP